MLHSRRDRDAIGRNRRAGGRAKPGVTAVQAALLGMAERTLRDWTLKADRPRRPVGNQGYGEAMRAAARGPVLAELQRQGWPGWRPVARALRGRVPTRLVQQWVAALKRERRRQEREAEMARRTSVRVLGRDVLWAEDGAAVGRSPRGQETMEVLRDAGPARTVAIAEGPPAAGEDLVTLLEGARRSRGTLPLVLSRDNGGPQKSQVLARYCARERVVVLRNHPRTPRHNPHAERAIGELKQVSGLDAGVRLPSRDEARTRLEDAWHRLDHHRLRARLGYRTAAAVDATMPGWYHRTTRGRFYEAARAAIEEATARCSTARARRLAEREAIFRTLEEFGLISRTRGGRPLTRKDAATIA
jgi:hypothetical protein